MALALLKNMGGMDTTELKIFPSCGVGDIRLGSTLYQVMKTLNANETDSGVEFNFGNNTGIILVYLSEWGINLIFDRFQQRLVLIEIKLRQIEDTMLDIKFGYKNEIINKFNFNLIYNRYFGPTYEGFYNELQDYFLSYRGITFKFCEIEQEYCSNEILSTTDKDFNCCSIFLYQDTGLDSTRFLWSEYTEKLSNLLNSSSDIKFIQSLKQFSPFIYKNDKHFNIAYSKYSSSNHILTFYFYKHHLNIDKFEVKFGKTTLQEMVRVFGLPNDSILKRKIRSDCIQMKKFVIEGTGLEFTTSRTYLPEQMVAKKKDLGAKLNFDSNFIENFNQELIRIHNYFDLGFDVVYDLNVCMNGSNPVSRMIIHQNCIGSIDFLKYEKLTLFYDSDNFKFKLKDIKEEVKLTGYSIFLDRKEYNIQEDFEVDLKETDRFFEFIDDSNDSNENDINNTDLKLWGLTIYDGCKSAIFEALSETDDICTITLF